MKGERKKLKSSCKVIAFLTILFVFLIHPCLAAEDPAKFPSKPIELVVNFEAGGNSDLTCRKLGELAGKVLGQPVVVVNKVGGGGVIGINAAVKAPPDGYTIASVTYSPTTIIPHLRSVPYNTKEDFTFLMQYGTYIYVFGVLPNSPWKTFKEFIEEARKSPGKLKYSTPILLLRVCG